MMKRAVQDDICMRKSFKNEEYQLKEEDIVKYYKSNSNEKLQDLIRNNDSNIYTICVINSCTGACLDSITRSRKNKLRAFSIVKAYKRDIRYLRQLLDAIKIINLNIPIFIPNINLVSYISPLVFLSNFVLKRIMKEHFNAYLVKPIFTKGLYIRRKNGRKVPFFVV